MFSAMVRFTVSLNIPTDRVFKSVYLGLNFFREERDSASKSEINCS